MSVVVADFQVNGSNPSTVGGTGTAVKYFPRPFGTGGPGGALPSTPSSTSAVGQLPVPGFNIFNGQILEVVASGDFVADEVDGSPTLTVKLFAQTGSLTSPTYTQLASTGTITPTANATYGNWALDVVMSGDTNSGIVGGYYTAWWNNTIVTPTALTNSLSSINFNSGIGGAGQYGVPFGLVVGVTFSVSEATNSAHMYQFQILQ
jgi:hypothetical protein